MLLFLLLLRLLDMIRVVWRWFDWEVSFSPINRFFPDVSH